MEELFRFIQKSERERICLIQEARAVYDSILLSAASVTEQSEKAPIGHAVNSANAFYNNGAFT
jgi:hypothetical protein